MDITVFSAPGCHKCQVTKSHLKRRGVDYHEVNVADYPGMSETIIGSTGTQLPVVMAFRSDEDETPDIIVDYHPDDIEALAHGRNAREWPPEPR